MTTYQLNGLRYHVEDSRSPGDAIVLLHGFTGGSASWAPLAVRLARHNRVIAPDLIGHGRTDSPAQAERYRIEHAAADLIALLDVLELANAHWVGYSMGARLALHTALRHPQRVKTLTLESGSPGLATPEERAARIAADAHLAARIEKDGVAAFVTHWESLPLFASQASLPEATRDCIRQARLRNSPLGLANSLRGMGTGAQPSGWADLATFARPTQLIVGALDAKFMAIAAQMHAELPNARCTVVQGAGHTVHVEQPAAWYAMVRRVVRGRGTTPLTPSAETRTR